MSQVPPPRYRIVERNRRLIVTDNWARDLLPAKAGDTANRVVRAGEDGGTLLRRLALTACGGAEDAEGRPIFTSASWFDTRAKREFSLGKSGVERLGGTALVFLMLVAFFFVLAFIIGFEALFIAFILLVVAGKNIESVGTRWVDRLQKLPID